MSYQAWFSDINLSRPESEIIVDVLNRDGFKCKIELDAVTSWYSNTDWDTDDLLIISWE